MIQKNHNTGSIRKAADYLFFFMIWCTIDYERVIYILRIIAGGLYDKVQRLAERSGRKASETCGFSLDHLVQRAFYHFISRVDQRSFSARNRENEFFSRRVLYGDDDP